MIEIVKMPTELAEITGLIMRSPPSIERTIPMATTDTTATDIALSDDAMAEDSSNNSFGKEIAKSLITSVATTAAMVGGMVAIGYASAKVQQFRANRAAAKAEPEVHVVTDLPEDPQTEI